MKTLKSLKPEQVDNSTKEVFEAITQKVGMLPNLYAAMGNSSHLINGFLAFEATLKEGEFSLRENEAIALAVSQVNGCDYCLAAHSAIGKMVGFSDDQIMDIRKGESDDNKLKALTYLASEFAKNKGKASDDVIRNFFVAGYSQQAFAELIGMVAIRTITNTIYSNGDFEIDFPRAVEIEEQDLA